MNKCFRCGGQVIWQSDFDTEDYGIEEEGIVSVYLCSKCNSDYTVTTLIGDSDEEND